MSPLAERAKPAPGSVSKLLAEHRPSGRAGAVMPARSAPSTPFVFAMALASACSACAAPLAAVIEIPPPSGALLPLETTGPVPGPPAEPAPGCAWTAPVLFARGDALPLCFAVDGACFARAPSPLQAGVTLTLPAGDPLQTGARLDISDDGVTLRAWTAGDEALLFPETPIVLNDAVIAHGGSSLHVVRVGSNTVDLVLEPGGGLNVRGPSLRARAACNDVGIERQRLSPQSIRAAAGVQGGEGAERALPVGKAVTMALSPAGREAAELLAEDEEDARVELIEQRGRQARVLWWRAREAVFGWVDAAALSVPATPPASAQGPGVGAAQGRPGPPPAPGTHCPADVPLLADFMGHREEVGVIGKAARFDVGKRVGDVTIVRLRSRNVVLEADASWLVPTAALAPCVIE